MWNIETLSDLRNAVMDALRDGLTGVQVLDYTTNRFTPPVAVVTPDEPYLVPGTTFGTWDVRIKVVLITNIKDSANALDLLTFQAINALEDFNLVEVSAPQEVTLRQRGVDATYWGSLLTLELTTTLKEDN